MICVGGFCPRGHFMFSHSVLKLFTITSQYFYKKLTLAVCLNRVYIDRLKGPTFETDGKHVKYLGGIIDSHPKWSISKNI